MKKRILEIEETRTYRHEIILNGESDGQLSHIGDQIGNSIADGEVENIDYIFGMIKAGGADYEFIQDGSPDVRYEVY